MTGVVTTVNPATEETIEEYVRTSSAEVENAITRSVAAYDQWRTTDPGARASLFRRLANELEWDASRAAEMIVLEMGKPTSQAAAEIQKCVDLCRFYADHADHLLRRHPVKTEAVSSYVRFDPIGPILGIMPWNFPYWQVFRWAIPTLTAGNTAILKHADNVLGAASHLQELFARAEAPLGLFESLCLDNEHVRMVIEDSRVRGASLTGSVRAGRAVASIAGGVGKPTILELGGSDACLVLNDADLDAHFDLILNARFQNTGQTCIAAKRYLVGKQIADEFTYRLVKATSELRVGDPSNQATQIGPMARDDLREALTEQVHRCRDEGLSVPVGGAPLDRVGYFFQPTVVLGATPRSPTFREEFFGPVASVSVCESVEQMVDWANATDFGLSANIWTRDLELGERLCSQLDVGVAYVNQPVKSDPRLPFGGTKDSGYGRELGGFGVRAFSNKKTVWIGDGS